MFWHVQTWELAIFSLGWHLLRKIHVWTHFIHTHVSINFFFWWGWPFTLYSRTPPWVVIQEAPKCQLVILRILGQLGCRLLLSPPNLSASTPKGLTQFRLTLTLLILKANDFLVEQSWGLRHGLVAFNCGFLLTWLQARSLLWLEGRQCSRA